ncbi:MAG: diaminopimelate decarboxylase [Oxalobacter sp.]|jgi:diaminopimelate decarboxylase|nr:diaminopimelate decarboxylase [Oxalobacter sp.]
MTEGYFAYKDNVLMAEGVALDALAKQYGTPLYVYSKAAFKDHLAQYMEAAARYETEKLRSLVCYSVKSNSNIAILNVLAKQGAGFDIVSGGELSRVLAAGGNSQKVIYSGVGKTQGEIKLALQHGILCFNVESVSELKMIDRIAGEMGKKAPVSFRVNPNVDAKTHPYISTGLKKNKFGIPFEEVISAYGLATSLENIAVIGIDCHIGSQLLDDAPLLEALDKVINLVNQLSGKGIQLNHIDIGGGIGITYDDEKPVAIQDYISRVFTKVKAWQDVYCPDRQVTVMFEPGRSISGNAGVLLGQVQYIKSNSGKNFAIVDAAMNDLMRPSLYDAYHGVKPVIIRHVSAGNYEIVGPICESGDWLARDRELAIAEGDYLAFMSAGAYGMSMASNYNTRGRAAEVLVDGDKDYLIRRREVSDDLIALETIVA